MMSHIVINIFVITLLIAVLSAQNAGNSDRTITSGEKRTLDAIIDPENYDRRIRPSGENGGFTVVNVSISFRSCSVDDYNMELSCHIIFHQWWNDKRLEYNQGTVPDTPIRLNDVDKIWTPDLVFDQEKQGHVQSVVKPITLITVNPNGDIHYSTRLSILLPCPMDLKNFPFDKQTCSIPFLPNGFTTDEVVLRWKEETPVSMKNLYFSQYAFSHDYTNYYAANSISGSEYSYLRLDLHLERKLSHYLIHIYIPCFMMCIVSWVSFWMDKKALTARVLISITTLLALAMMTYWIHSSLPPVSYTKAVDVWTGVCLTFVFVALLEIATVNYWPRMPNFRSHCDNKEKIEDIELNQKDNNLENLERKPISDDQDNKSKDKNQNSRSKISEILDKCPGYTSFMTWFDHESPSFSDKLDGISKICFPLAFVIFNICYWTTYLPRE